MAGLLGENYEDPKTQGILGFALQMLANSGGAPRRRTAGEIIGASGLGGMEQYNRQRALNAKLEEEKQIAELRRVQMTQLLDRLQQQKLLRQAGIDSYQTPLGEANSMVSDATGNLAPTVENAALQAQAAKTATGGINPQLFMQNAMRSRVDPLLAAQTAQALEKTGDKPLVVGNNIYWPKERRFEAGPTPEKANKGPTSWEEFQRAYPEGTPEQYRAFIEKRDAAKGVKVTLPGGPKVVNPLLVESGKGLIAAATKLGDTWTSKVPALARIENNIRKGMIQGSFANVRSEIGKFFGLLGVASEEVQAALTNTESATQALADLSIKTVKELGANPSNADMILQRIRNGDVTNQAQALMLIMQATRADLANTVRTHNNRAAAWLRDNPEDAPRLSSSMIVDTKNLPNMAIDAAAFEPDPQTGYYMPRSDYTGDPSLPTQNIFGPTGQQPQFYIGQKGRDKNGKSVTWDGKGWKYD